MATSDNALVESTLAFLQTHIALSGLLDGYEQRHELPEEDQITVHLETLRKHRVGATTFLIQYGHYAPENAECIVAQLCAAWERCAATPWGYLDLADAHEIIQQSAAQFATAINLYELPKPAKPFANPPSPPPPPPPIEGASHSEDFRSVRWCGTEYAFTTMQAACVQVMWQSWERGAPEMSQVIILEDAGSASERLRDVFDKGKHTAWGTMIVAGRKGAFRLAKPA